MDIPLRNVSVFVYAFWHHLLKNGYKKRRCISTFFSNTYEYKKCHHSNPCFFVIGEAVSILVSCDMVEIFYSTLKNPFLLEISSKSINFICVDAFSSLLFPHNKLLSICLKTYHVSLFICNIIFDCLFS